MEPTDANLQAYRETLRRWWPGNARQYPWRQSRAPYRTAVAEIMLRRTRAEQVVPTYERFLDAFPTLDAAAHADPAEVRELMYPLGLRWRADNMVEFVREAYAQYGSELPADANALRALPGVGDYVGAAVACFSGDEALALVDTNIASVLGRIFGLDTRGEARRRRAIRDLAARALDRAGPADYHYALLDFAARVCLARNPRCDACPFSVGATCDYFRGVVRQDQPGYEAQGGDRDA